MGPTAHGARAPVIAARSAPDGPAPGAGGAHGERIARALLVLLAGAFLFVLLRTAWVSDDAYISFRVVDNLAHGHGPRWNLSERVQAFTNPLWVLVLTPLYLVTGELYVTSIALSIALSSGAFLLLVARAESGPARVLVAAALLSSKAFVDYSTSGLENSLGHVLVCLFALETTRSRPVPLRASLLLALAALNRLDALLLLGPAWLARAPPWLRSRGSLVRVLAGFAPLLAWLAFAALYYGTPLPNTALAKVGVPGVPLAQIVRQGVWYYLESAAFDPLMPLVVAAGLAMGLSGRSRRSGAPLAVGIALHLAYVLAIGGGFMAGRFLTLPFVLALFLVARVRMPARVAWLGAAAALAVGLLAPRPNLASGPGYDHRDSAHDITDERGYYFQNTGLWSDRRRGWERLGRPLEEPSPHPSPYLLLAIGHFGFVHGRSVEVLDGLGLADPLLARVPLRVGTRWRPGHTRRGIPRGYHESLRVDENRIEDPDLHAYYGALRALSREPVLSAQRLRTVLAFHLGRHDGRLRRYVEHAYARDIGPLELRLADLAGPLPAPGTSPEGSAWLLRPAGARIRLSAPCAARELVLAVDGRDLHGLVYLRSGERVGETAVSPAGADGLAHARVVTPASAAAATFDELWIVPVAGDGFGYLGGIELR